MSGEQKNSGCLKGCLIGCGVVFVLGVVVIVVVITQAGRIVSLAADRIGNTVMESVDQKLPEGYDRQMVRDTFKTGIQALKNGEIDRAEVQEIGDYLQAALADDTLTTAETDELLQMIKQAAESKPTSGI